MMNISLLKRFEVTKPSRIRIMIIQFLSGDEDE